MAASDRTVSISPSRDLAETGARLREELGRVGDSLAPEGFTRLISPLVKSIFVNSCRRSGADEGAVWLADSEEENLIPVFGFGDAAEQFVGNFRQPLSSGLVSMVYGTGQSICENEIQQNPGHSTLLDETLKYKTLAMIAVPLYFANRLRGVVSCVHLSTAQTETHAFSTDDLREVELSAASLERLLDLALIENLLGWTNA